MAGTNIPALLVTANVGSIFEDPGIMLKIWTEEFLQTVARLDPKFIAVHCQEVGGKNYEQSMQHVEYFVRLLMESEELRLFDKVRIYLDEDFSSAEHFTALGNFYFIHESVTDVLVWDFIASSFVPVDGKEVHSANIEAISTKEKAKFPQDFFPSCKWSRKGFLRTRWNLNGTVFDLINIHLFHDASNFVAMEMFPSVYCKNRRRALEYTLDRFHTDAFGTAPFFVFGDFNFRTDTKGVVNKLVEGLSETRVQSQKTDHTKMQYHDENCQVVFSLGKKEFNHQNHQRLFDDGKWLKEFDRELESFEGRLFEFPITFGPSYPYEENENGAKSYMKTRCPSWCDRVILSNTATSLVNNISEKSGIEYDIIGANTCMGDHKPVYLRLELLADAGTVPCCPVGRAASISASLCLNGLSRSPILDTLTLPRASYVHDEPYTPESMDTPSPLPSPLPGEAEEAQRRFNVSLTARLRQESSSLADGQESSGRGSDDDERYLDAARVKDKIESPFSFLVSEPYQLGVSENPKSRSFGCFRADSESKKSQDKTVFNSSMDGCFSTLDDHDVPDLKRVADWEGPYQLDSPKVLVTQYVQEQLPGTHVEAASSKTDNCDSSLLTDVEHDSFCLVSAGDPSATLASELEAALGNSSSRIADYEDDTDVTKDLKKVACHSNVDIPELGNVTCHSSVHIPSVLTVANLEANVDQTKTKVEANKLCLSQENLRVDSQISKVDIEKFDVVNRNSIIEDENSEILKGTNVLIEKDLNIGTSALKELDCLFADSDKNSTSMAGESSFSSTIVVPQHVDKPYSTGNAEVSVEEDAVGDRQRNVEVCLELPSADVEAAVTMSSATTGDRAEAEASCPPQSTDNSENGHAPVVSSVDLHRIESPGDVDGPKTAMSVVATEKTSVNAQHFPLVKRAQSHSTAGSNVSALGNTEASLPDEDCSVSPRLRSNRCFSDASGLKRKAFHKVSRVRLISASESLHRLQSHHSSSDEDWFEEDKDSDNGSDMEAASSEEVCESLVDSSWNNNVDKTGKGVQMISPLFEMHSSVSMGMIDGSAFSVLLPYSNSDINAVDSYGRTIPTDQFEVLRIFKKQPSDLESSNSQVCGGISGSNLPMLKAAGVEVELSVTDHLPEADAPDAEGKCFACGRCIII